MRWIAALLVAALCASPALAPSARAQSAGAPSAGAPSAGAPSAGAQGPSPGSAPSVDTSPGSTGALMLDLIQTDLSHNFLVLQGADVHALGHRSEDDQRLLEAAYGNLQNGSLGDTDSTIKEFMKKHGKLFGFAENQDPLAGMHKFREFSSGDGKWLQYCPVKDGLDYVSALMTYVFRSSGQLCAVVGRYRPLTGAIGGGLSKQAAIQKAVDQIKKDIPWVEPDVTGPVKIAECLVSDVNGQSTPQRLISVTLVVGDPPRPKRVILLGSGDALWTEDGAYSGCTGAIFKQDPVTDNEERSKEDLPDIVPAAHFWKSYVINGTNVKVDSPEAPSRASSFFGNFSHAAFEPDPNEKFAEYNAYYYLTRGLKRAQEAGLTDKETQPFLPLYFDHWAGQECYHLESTENDTDPAEAAKKDKEAADCRRQKMGNAWFDPGSMHIYFANDNTGFVRKTEGDKKTYKHTAYESTIATHEFGHWVHYILNPHHLLTGTETANLEGRAVQEAVADIFSAIICDNPVIAGYFLGDAKRDMRTKFKYVDVIPMWSVPVPAGEKGKTYHAASQAFSGTFWEIKGDLHDDALALRILIAAMRMCHTPCRFQNMAEAVLAMDQQLNSSPLGKRMADRFRTTEMVQRVAGR